MAKTVFPLLVALLTTQAVHADVRVTFVNPDSYSDFRTEPARLRDGILNDLRKTLIALGTEYLRPGETLVIDVLDVQRAGMLRDLTPSHTAILTDATPPRIEVNYLLMQKGRTLLQAHETITDIDYFEDPSAHLSSDAQVYEKHLLANWFRKRFKDGVPPSQ